jgi:hypothetical protein
MRTFAAPASLPFDVPAASDPSETGRQRMKGAYLIDVERIRPDPTQPRREFDADQMEHLTASVRDSIGFVARRRGRGS